jgi:hypothetical protein
MEIIKIHKFSTHSQLPVIYLFLFASQKKNRQTNKYTHTHTQSKEFKKKTTENFENHMEIWWAIKKSISGP